MDLNSQNNINEENYSSEHEIKSFTSSDLKTSNEDSLTNNRWVSKFDKYEFIKEYKVNVYDVAAYILFKLGEMTTMKLHKILYYCQAWSLVWDEKPLFDEEIEAWANGPVIRDLFYYHKGNFTISNLPIGNKELLNKNQSETIDSVLKYYGVKSAQWLIELSHLEDPWKNARTGLKQNDRGNKVISLESMAEYYSSLI